MEVAGKSYLVCPKEEAQVLLDPAFTWSLKGAFDEVSGMSRYYMVTHVDSNHKPRWADVLLTSRAKTRPITNDIIKAEVAKRSGA